MSLTVRGYLRSLIRKKHIDISGISETKLDRCLTTVDLTFLGIGSTLGLGIYVIAGQVASTKAGPAVALSFLVAAIASVFAGLCYAEFGARVPKAGSAYIYSYVTVGELMAFIIGWNLVLEYVIGAASVARGYSSYIDSLFNSTIQSSLQHYLPMNVPHFSTYPDFLSLGITLLLSVMLAVGVKESTKFNNVFTCLNLLVVLYVVICGSFKADIRNWQFKKEEVPEDAGNGGFFPYGFEKMMSGAATCFYGFVGFDCVATTGEEAKNPQRAIPISIVLSLFFVFVAYFSVSIVTTLMCPYWLLDRGAPLPFAFEHVGWDTAKWVITIGALAGLSTSLLGAMFPLPRVLYAMASDGVIFRGLAKIHPRFKTPLIATIISGFFAGCMSMMFNVKELADMMSIGTLLAYTLVAISVLILRYKENMENLRLRPPFGASDDNSLYKNASTEGIQVTASMSSNSLIIPLEHYTGQDILRQLFNPEQLDTPTQITSRTSVYLIIVIGLATFVLDALLVFLHYDLADGDILSICLVAVAAVICSVLVYALWRQPTNNRKISFMVPFIPFTPLLSVFINIYLMLKLPVDTWIRFGIWMGIGFLIYFLYGNWHSSERNRRIDTIAECASESDIGEQITEDSPLVTKPPKE